MWKKIGVGLLALVAGILVFAATRPDTFRVERSVAIEAPPEVVYSIVSDLRQGKEWSPWERLDPDMKKTFSGPETGVGSEFSWEGNDKAGKGSQKIIRTDPPNKVITELHFIEPFEATNEAEFIIQKQGNGSQVTWAMYGPSPYVSKLIGLFLDMDTLLGKDFEAGLSSLKQLAERKANTAS